MSEESKEPQSAPASFSKAFGGGQVAETTTTTTTTEGTTSTTTPAEVAEQAPSPVEKNEEPSRKPRRARGYENVPEVVETLKSATEALTDAVKTVTTKPTADGQDTFEYTEDELQQLETFERMAKMNPQQYKKLPGLARDFIKSYEKNREKFLEKNPEMTDDELEDAMTKLREESGVVWSERDFNKALIDIKVSPVIEENKELRQKIDRVEQEDHQLKIEPVAKKRAAVVARDEVAAKLGDYANIVTSAGEINPDFESKLIDDDPLIADIVVGAVQDSKDFTEACVLVFSGGRSPIGNHVVAWAKHVESELSKLPVEDRVNSSGQQFVPRSEWNKMTAKQREKHWVVGPDEIIPFFTKSVTAEAGKKIKAIKDRDEKKYPKPVAPKPDIKPDSPSSIDTPPPVVQQAAAGFMKRMAEGTSR